MKKINLNKEINLNEDVDLKKVSSKAKGTMKEFKDFATKGNLIDMAVGVVIGTAFSKIVTSLVNDIIMPLISLATQGIDFSQLFISLDGNTYATLEEATAAGAATLTYGNFITAVIDFLIIAFSIFIVTKKIFVSHKKVEEAPAPATTKICPYCKTEINKAATRCPNCTSELQ